MLIDSVNDLTVIDQASRALAEAKSLSEIKAIRDKAEAVRKYAASAALGLSAQNYAAEIKLRAERKAGVLLSKMSLRGGDRKSNGHDARLKLDDLGISQSQSSRWQLQARLPIDKFEQYLMLTREAGREISTTAVLRLARRAGKNGAAKKNGANGRSSKDCEFASFDSGNKLGGETPLEDGLTELAHHRDLLERILQPIYSGSNDELLPAQRRVLGDILHDMDDLLRQLRRMVRHEWCNLSKTKSATLVHRPIEIIAQR